MGKTQLFRILAGLQQPDVGEVRVDRDQHRVRAGTVGVVAQQCPLFEHRTVLGNLLVASGGKPGAAEEAESLLARFGLEEAGQLYPCQLSGGQRQRVAIAQQFMCSEHFLLMDEPFSGLDPLAVEAVCSLITEVANQDDLNTIIVVTHDIAAALAVADHLWLLGRDRDARGEPIAGARVQCVYDLIARGLAWQPGRSQTPEYQTLFAEIRERFRTL